MPKKHASHSSIDHFFHQRKQTFQIIGQYGLFWVSLGWIMGVVASVMLVTTFGLGLQLMRSVKPDHIVTFVVHGVFLFRLFRRYTNGHVFSLTNTRLLVALSTYDFVIVDPILGILLLGVSFLVPIHDVDTDTTDA